MFGKNKGHDARLTEKQIKELTKNMSGKELRQFKQSQKDLEKAQKREEDNAFWDGLLWGSLFDED